MLTLLCGLSGPRGTACARAHALPAVLPLCWQVTNPPIDPLREGLVMSLEMRLGKRGNLLQPDTDSYRQVRAQHMPAAPACLAAAVDECMVGGALEEADAHAVLRQAGALGRLGFRSLGQNFHFHPRHLPQRLIFIKLCMETYLMA